MTTTNLNVSYTAYHYGTVSKQHSSLCTWCNHVMKV